jgi:hypothetical protein
MRTRLTDVVGWAGRNIPGERVIPAHLKLAILTRGRVILPTSQVEWLLDVARAAGHTWPNRLRRDLPDIVARVPIVVELFMNQRPSLTGLEIAEVFTGYLSLRRRRHLPRTVLLWTWRTHDRRRNLEDDLDLDIGLLFAKAHVRERRDAPEQFLLLVYACLPDTITAFVAPERPGPPSLPPSPMPPLLAVTSPSTSMNLRDAAGDSSNVLGRQVGHIVPVDVVGKQTVERDLWLDISPRVDLRVEVKGKPGVIKAGRRCWILGEGERPPSLSQKLLFNKGPSRVGGGLERIAAPWAVFRTQLRDYEAETASLGLDERITRLRQMSHDKDVPFDAVIGAGRGALYLDDRQPDPQAWQLLKDYQAVVAPDGRIVDLHHLVVGLDALSHREQPSVMFVGMDVGSNWGAATWAGDLGAAASDMLWRSGKEWEQRNPKADFRTRAQYYFETRAGDHDLVADVDVWGIHALRSAKFDSIDAIVASYYEHTILGQIGSLTSARRRALEMFLTHYGFAYDAQSDYPKYPVLVTQSRPFARVSSEIARFARVWSFRTKPLEKGKIDGDMVKAMVLLFLFWLEHQAIENDVLARLDR